MGSSGRKASKKENQLGRTSLWTKEARRYRGGQTCPLLPAAPLQGASSWGAGAPSISGFILCCPPLPPWGVYPSSCYKGSILTNIIKNQGEAQGEPGSGRDIKDLEAFGPSNGEEVGTLWRRSASRFPAPTHHCFAGGAGLASSLCLQLPVSPSSSLLGEWELCRSLPRTTPPPLPPHFWPRADRGDKGHRWYAFWPQRGRWPDLPQGRQGGSREGRGPYEVRGPGAPPCFTGEVLLSKVLIL